MSRRHRTTARSLVALLALWVYAGTAHAAVPRLDFPVIGVAQHIDDFGDPRSSGRSHEGNDIMAKRRTPVVAVESGSVYKPSWSSSDCALVLEGASGTDYRYLHLNNDLTTSNDNDGGCRNGVSFAGDLPKRKDVKKAVAVGQLIGYVGNSGNADATSPHLHFEVRPGSSAVDPYEHLRKARRLLFAVPGSVTSLRLSLSGRFSSAADGVLELNVSRTYVRKKWRSVPTRRVSLAYGDDLVVERRDSGGDVTAARLTGAKQGERAVVKTGIISGRALIRSAQLRRAGIMVATRLQLRG